MPFWLLPICKLFSQVGFGAVGTVKSFWSRWVKLGNVETKKILQLKEEIKLHLFNIINHINIEIAQFEMTYVYPTDEKLVKSDLLKDRHKIEASCRASIIELEKITVVKEAYLQKKFVTQASKLIDKVKFRNWEEHSKPDHDTYGSLIALADEINVLLKHDVVI